MPTATEFRAAAAELLGAADEVLANSQSLGGALGGATRGGLLTQWSNQNVATAQRMCQTSAQAFTRVADVAEERAIQCDLYQQAYDEYVRADLAYDKAHDKWKSRNDRRWDEYKRGDRDSYSRAPKSSILKAGRPTKPVKPFDYIDLT